MTFWHWPQGFVTVLRGGWTFSNILCSLQVKLYKFLTEQTTDSVYILSQYNAQCAEIKRHLRQERLSDQHVSTVVSSQGIFTEK